MGGSLIDAPSLRLEKVKTTNETQGSIVGFLGILDFVLHVFALPDDNASSQHSMPKPSFSVTNPTRLELRRSAWMQLLTISRIVHP